MRGLKAHIADYSGSEHFFFLEDQSKPHAEALLDCFWTGASDTLSNASMLAGLSAVAATALPADVKRRFPNLLKAYVEYLSTTGHVTDAEEWTDLVDAAEKDFVASIRDDGSVKGETVRNRHTAVGRNEPCPCGSGKKFKKCCGG